MQQLAYWYEKLGILICCIQYSNLAKNLLYKTMKIINITIALILVTFSYSQAQLDYPTQPQAGYYENLKAMVLPVIPTEAALINLKQGVIPVNFKDTLSKYDWYEIANYYFYDKEYGSYFLDDLESREKVQASNQFNFFRYTNGIRYESSLHRYKDGSMKVNHTMFDVNTATKFVDVKIIGTRTVLIQSTFGENEMIDIVSFEKGVMVLSIKQYPTATTKRYHIAYRAVPRMF